MANLVELFDNIVQMQNLNGVPLAAGKLYVYALGRTRLMDSWSDVDGESLNPNPIILDDAGQAHVYVSDDFDYTLVVCDQYNNEIFSLDKYLYSKGSHSHADVAVAPSESIAVSSYHVGETTVYVPYLTGQLGKVYEGIDPIVVNNQVDKISANHVPLGVQDPLYFVQDDEEACIIGFSGETLPEGTMNESAFGYEDGKITGYNGSGFSAGLNYEAGSYVDIDGNTINVTGLQPAGNYQSAGDYVVHDELSSYATQDWVENQSYMKEYMESAFYPSTSNPSGYLTEHQDLSDYAKTEDLTAYQEKGNYYSASNPDGFINSDAISAMATTGFVADVSGDITALIPTDLFTKESADTLYQPIGDYQTAGNYVSASELTAYATTSLVSSVSSTITGMIPTGDFELVGGTNIELVDDAVNHTTTINMTADIPSTAGLATTAQLAEVSGDITAQIPTDLFTKASADTLYQPIGNYLSSNALEGYATENWVTSQGYITNDSITGKQDITGMTAYQEAGDYLSANALDNLSGNWENVTAKQDALAFGYHDTVISSIDESALYDNSAHARINTLAGRISDLSSNKLDTTAFSDVSGNFLTTIPDTYLQNTDLTITDGKVTEISGVPLSAGDELPESVSAATDYVTANSATINGTVETVSSNSGSWGGEALPLSSRDGIDLEIVGDMLYIGASALTASIDEKLDAAVYAADSGSFLTAHQSLDGYLQNTDLEISDNKITGISGVPLAAGGGDVPEGVMAESGLEFNAVDEISGYNGSAFAQYGAEKQWLVHDDTLVHAANSAQYALGVNVSAVQTLMGLDETVLFSGNLTGNGATAQLSEPITNFDRIKVYGHTDDGIDYPWFTEFYPTENTTNVGVASNNAGWAKWFYFSITTGGLYTNVTGKVHTFGTTGWGNLDFYGITRVIGVGRKEV